VKKGVSLTDKGDAITSGAIYSDPHLLSDRRVSDAERTNWACGGCRKAESGACVCVRVCASVITTYFCQCSGVKCVFVCMCIFCVVVWTESKGVGKEDGTEAKKGKQES
jgi:hypothetical protein